MKVYMFHYVVPKLNYYHYNLDLFDKTVKYLCENYNVISLKQYNKLISEKQVLDDKYIMLTFDDGTIDHYKYVFPTLKKYNCSGLFFLSSSNFNNNILHIQLIHKLLESVDLDELYVELLNLISVKNDVHCISHIDKEKFIKQQLQYKLEGSIRKNIIMSLVKKYNISLNNSDYYMDLGMIREMKKNNMFFGIHTDTHPRLEFLSYSDQEKEIKTNMDYLINNKLVENNLLSIAYPFGSFNNDTLSILKKLKINYGFKVNNNGASDNYLINREDCNVLRSMCK